MSRDFGWQGFQNEPLRRCVLSMPQVAGKQRRFSKGSEVRHKQATPPAAAYTATTSSNAPFLRYDSDRRASARYQAAAAPRMTGSASTEPSASPLSKSPSMSAIWLVTWAKQSTGFRRAAANA